MNKLTYIALILIAFTACNQTKTQKTETEYADTISVEIEREKDLVQVENLEPKVSEKITIDKYEQKSVMDISDSNAYLIVDKSYPDFNFQTDFVKRYFWQFSEYNDTTGSTKEICYGLIRRENEFFIDTLLTYKTLIEFEGCNESHQVNLYDSKDKVFLLIDKSAKLEIGKIEYLPLIDYDYHVTPSQRFIIQSDSNEITLDYNATLCEKTFEYNGLGTIMPTFFNITLKLTDSMTNDIQYLFISPHQHRALLHDIWIGDINGDKTYDYVLTYYANDVCEYRSLYLSNKADYKLVDYKGSYEMCDCP
ncbi:hypothetical protein [Xiashengella succiniciproducens]|uniref:Lipoprotein n=1 Tax=Xiashengella succiniciproducens TaxID=2949635 RepID=A0A9J6ZTI8_9BACT|nr:hypothetical protein [Alkaliflexus sp. Ai-910]URW80929.1 hypothetical protein M9189_06135 [Alkaliflexus sp. Ai-910]